MSSTFVIHVIVEALRVIMGVTIGWLATEPFVPSEPAHTAWAVIIAMFLMILVDIRVELTKTRKGEVDD